MGVAVVTDRPGHHGYIRLRFGVLVDRQRVLYPHEEPGADGLLAATEKELEPIVAATRRENDRLRGAANSYRLPSGTE